MNFALTFGSILLASAAFLLLLLCPTADSLAPRRPPADQLESAQTNHFDSQLLLAAQHNQRQSFQDPASESGAEMAAADEQANEESELANEPASQPQQEDQSASEQHQAQLEALKEQLLERRLLAGGQSASSRQQQQAAEQHNQTPMQASQELNPISIGLDPGVAPFSLPPFGIPGAAGLDAGGPATGSMANDDGTGGGAGGPALPFGLGPLPQLLGFGQGAQSPPSHLHHHHSFEGPQRGDQSAHSNQHAAASSDDNSEPAAGAQKVWPKIFRFTDGRINLSDFEKQKKIRLSSKHGTDSNHIESAPIMFDGRQLKRKSFLILHGGIFSR